MGVLEELLAEEASHLPVVEGFLVLVELAEDGAELQVTFAQVAKFEELARDVELLGRLHYVLLLSLC